MSKQVFLRFLWATQTSSKVDAKAGFSLLEVMVSIVLSSVAFLGLSTSVFTSLRIAKITEVQYAASSIAASRLEELLSVDTSTLNDTFDSEQGNVVWGGLNITFTRKVNVTVNPDSSRTIDVTVSSNAEGLPATINFSTTTALWE